MTPASKPHPQEYIFACDCCENKCKVISHNAIPPDCGCLINSDVGAIWSSRPHSSAPAPTGGWIRESFVTLYSNKLFTVGEVCNLIEGHRTAAAKAERERVLDELIEWLEPQKLPLLKQRMYRKLQSLRQQEEQP